MQTKFTELTDYQWQFIKKHVENHKPRKHCIRVILNAILWITRTGSQWRNLESKYPPWESAPGARCITISDNGKTKVY